MLFFKAFFFGESLINCFLNNYYKWFLKFLKIIFKFCSKSNFSPKTFFLVQKYYPNAFGIVCWSIIHKILYLIYDITDEIVFLIFKTT